MALREKKFFREKQKSHWIKFALCMNISLPENSQIYSIHTKEKGNFHFGKNYFPECHREEREEIEKV